MNQIKSADGIEFDQYYWGIDKSDNKTYLLKCSMKAGLKYLDNDVVSRSFYKYHIFGPAILPTAEELIGE